MTVSFRKQATEANALNLLKKGYKSSMKDAGKMSLLAKSIIEGENRVIRCHLVKDQNCLGRSLVIDLEADSDKNRFRLIDHRTIESIIFKNVKYVLKSQGGQSFRDIDTEIDKST